MTPAEFIDDPNWADFLPEMDRAPRVRALPTHEDCSRIDCESAAMHLRRGGTLGRMDGYEERPGQIDMLSAIVRAFNRHALRHRPRVQLARAPDDRGGNGRRQVACLSRPFDPLGRDERHSSRRLDGDSQLAEPADRI